MALPRALLAVGQRASGVSLLDYVPASERAALASGQSRYDCSAALTAALASNAGFIAIPAGRYPMLNPVQFTPHLAGRFAPGPQIIGDGPGRTILENRLGSSALFSFDSGASANDFYAITDLGLSGFSVEAVGQGNAATAIHLRGCYMTTLEDIHINGTHSNGLVIECRDGDNDGSNMVSLTRVRIENCTGWGIQAAGTPGHNEISFLRMQNVFVQNCGTDDGLDIPSSGGMRYKGQMLDMQDCGFTINRNVGMFIPGEAGLAINTAIRSTAFENNHGRHLMCTGTSVFSARNIQFFNNDANRASTACEFRGDHFTVRQVSFDDVTVRATPANSPYTAFSFSGANLEMPSCAVRNVIWEYFGFPGQQKAAGMAVQ